MTANGLSLTLRFFASVVRLRFASSSCRRFSCRRAVPSQLRDACRGEPPRLKLACKLGDDVPPLGGGRAFECHGEKVFNCRRNSHFVWPKGNRLTRTYVDSRKVTLTRVHRESSRIRRFCRVRVPSTPM
jgi:hypothetical protein